MKKLGSNLRSFATARLILFVIISGLIAVSFTATAFMQNSNGRQAKVNGKVSQVQDQQRSHPTADFWQEVFETPAAVQAGQQAPLQARRFRSFTLNRGAMQRALALAPMEFTTAARQGGFILSLPAPAGGFQRFAVSESPVMEPGLAEKHPDIKTYAGRGLDDRTATIRFDLTPLGFHASVRGQSGSWYIDPYYHLDQSLYISYFGRDLKNPHGPFVEHEDEEPSISADHSYYHGDHTVKLRGLGFGSRTTVTVTISDPEARSSTRKVVVGTDDSGSFELEFVASPDSSIGTRNIEASDGTRQTDITYDVVAEDGPDLATGDVLRQYRLALITDPGYSDYFGGSANVTPAKVSLVNRVTQVYEDDLSIRMVLVANNDLLNLDTWDKAIGPNGPCGAAGCFTQSQVTGCSSTARARFVIGQIIGASNYDIGHLALGQPGGGVASLGVVGRSAKAGGCTGIPTPTGDFYAVDYVAHEMGHQFSGNHPFNGNQLNCSGGNRSAANSVEPGSGSSVMAYAGICLTDDLQRHSDPYFSERSLQEIATYTTSSPAAINEVQTASLRHFGGGDEVQVVTFGPGYARASTIQPLSLTINAAPSATSLGGATESGNTVTIATGNGHTLQVGDTVTIAGVGVAGYNGTFTVTAVITSRSFQYTNPTSGLATSGGGTVTLAVPGATESGNTVTISTSAAHGRSVGDIVVIANVGVAGYNGTFAITAVPTPRTFQYTNPTAGLANSGGGTATFSSPFQVRIGGNDSAVIGGSGLAYTNANLTSAINAITGFAGTATVTGAASTGFTVTYSGASSGLDVPNIELVNLSCGGCFASVEETIHGGATDSFTLNYNGTDSALITNGVNYNAAGIIAALTPILPAGATVTIANFGGGGAPSSNGFQVTFGGTLAATNVPVLLSLTNPSTLLSGFFGETDKGGAVDNKGGIITATGNAVPVVTAPALFTIPLRTPFALTGSATDADLGDTLIYSWEQNDRGGTAGTTLLNNTKTNGPLFAMFPKSGQISDADSLLYNSPGENALTTNPTRVFPDLQQVLDDNTNAATGGCPTGPIAAPVPVAVTECFSEFLPTIDYVGFTGINATPLSLHFRFTARDGGGGVDSADTTLLIDNTAGPLRVTSQGSPVDYDSGSTQTVTWDVNSTDKPALAPNVMISLSTDGGATFPYVLVANTPNDGSEPVTLPNADTTTARLKVEAVSNVFFDVNHSNFTILAAPTPTPTPTPVCGFSDDFDDNTGPPAQTTKWTLGSLNDGPAANDPLVQVVEDQQLKITTRAQLVGNIKRYNGYVSTAAWDFTDGVSSVEVLHVARAVEYADTIFAVGIDRENWFRFVHEHGQLYFQTKVLDGKTSTNITYDAVQHHYWRLRHNVGTDQVFFETSAAEAGPWVVRRTVTRQIAITGSKFELSAGTFNWNDVADTAVFDNFVLLCLGAPSPTPTPTPTPVPGVLLSDDFDDNSRDTGKWNLGVVNRPGVAFDPLVQVQEVTQQLKITPRALIGGLHFNGYVSVSWDLTDARAAVEVVQSTNPTDYAETVFCLGIDDGYWYRMMEEHGQLYFQFRNGGAISSTNIAYNAVAHRFWRMGHKPAGNQLLFQTSSDGIVWATQRTVAVSVPLTALKIELSAGTYNVVSPTGTAIFDNFVLETPGLALLVRPLQFGRDLQAGNRGGRGPAARVESRSLWRRQLIAATGG